MKILVTGGAGFMGSNFIRHNLNKHRDYEIVNLDKLTYAGNLNNLRDVEKNKRYGFVKGDIADDKIVDELANGADVIINYAAETHVDRSILGPTSFIITDVLGTFVLLEAARKNDLKFIQIGTDEVYGSIDKGSFNEEAALQPNNPYSASKAAADLLIRSYIKTYGLKAVITRSCNNFGQFQHPEKLIPRFITNLLIGKQVPLYGKGQNIREWIFVLDHCSAIDFILQKGKEEIYNIGSGQEKKNIEVTNFILNELGAGKDMIDFVKDRPGHDFRYSLNCKKLYSLGWRPIFKFEEALKQTIEWYKQNEWWWRPLVK